MNKYSMKKCLICPNEFKNIGGKKFCSVYCRKMAYWAISFTRTRGITYKSEHQRGYVSKECKGNRTEAEKCKMKHCGCLCHEFIKEQANNKRQKLRCRRSF